MLMTSRWILRVLNWLNWGVGVLILAALLFIGFDAPNLTARINDVPVDPEELMTFARWMIPAILLIVPLVHIILGRLIAMIDSVPAGTALSSVNAERLRQIAWALIGINVIDLSISFAALVALPDEHNNFVFGVTGWVAALMLFILARIFREGAAMREELEGTV